MPSPEKKQRLERLARKIAAIVYEDIQQHGALKPNYMSPKFWAYVQRAMKVLEEQDSGESQPG